MTSHAYVLTWVGFDLMHLLGWVSIHDTHQHMGVLRKILLLVFLVCGFFLGCYSMFHDCPHSHHASAPKGEDKVLLPLPSSFAPFVP